MRGLSRRGRIHTPRGGPGRLDPVQLGEALAGRSHSNVTTRPACLSPTQLSNSVRGSEASTSNAGPRKKRGRGPTRLQRLWSRDPNAPFISCT